jgi:hypothetical protein
MRTRLMCLTLASALFCCAYTADAFNKAGRTAMQFVKIGTGARQTGMGESGIALIRDVNAIFWNPAGIAGVKSAEASFSYNKWFVDMAYLSGAVAYRWEDVGIFGLSWSSLDYGTIQEALVKSTTGSSDTRTGNSVTGNDLWVGLSYCREFSENLSIGLSVKYLREKLYVYSGDAFAFDVGTFYDTRFKGIRFGMSFQNFGSSVKFLDQGLQEEGYDLPLVFRIGVAMSLLAPGDALISSLEGHTLTVAFEAINSNDYGERYNLGGEYVFTGLKGVQLALRGGYRFNYDDGNLCLGAGLSTTISNMEVRFDYSYMGFEFLESPNRVTLTVAF